MRALWIATLVCGGCGAPAVEADHPRSPPTEGSCTSAANADRNACRSALAEDTDALEESLIMTLKASGIAPLQGDPWSGPRTFASSLARFQTFASPSPEDVKLVSAAQELMRDSLRFDADTDRLHSSCADIAELEKGMHAVGAFTAQRFQRVIAVRRNTEIELAQRRIHSITAKEYAAGDAAASVQKDVETAHKMLAELQCYDAAVAKIADADLSRWSSKVEADLAAKKKH
jgi:hypothetical protein